MPNILPSLVPLQIADDCIDSLPINCGDIGPSSDNSDATFTIEFPRNISTLPLAGGAVLSIGVPDLKLKSSLNVAQVLTRNLTNLQGLGLLNSMEDLVRSRVAVNNGLFEIARNNLKVVDENANSRKAPSVYLAIFKGEDSSVIKQGIANPDMIRFCEFRYIPVEAFKDILNNLTEAGESEFKNVVGVSGRSYEDLRTLAVSLAENNNSLIPSFPAVGGNDADIVDLVLEFFPVVNMSETSLSGSRSNPIIGGYYTILDEKIYFKIPDLTGRDAAGQSNGIINSDSSLWIEVLSGAVITRSEIQNFKMPPLASFIGDQQNEFPAESTLEIIFELAEDDNPKVYLSPIIKNQVVSKKRSITTFSNSIELFSVPVLTLPIQSGAARLATINDNSNPSFEDISITTNIVKQFYPNFVPSKEAGYPYIGQEDAHVFFGEMNRPEIILSGNGNTDSKNNNQYINLSSYGALDILNSIRTKYYENVPNQWLSAIPTKNNDGNYVAKFAGNLFQDIDLVGLNGSIEYAVYVGDSLGQLTRIAGPNLKLSDATPSISQVTPDGFNGSKSLIISDDNIIQIFGEDLGRVQQIAFTSRNTGTLLTPFIPGDGVMSNPTDSSITLDFSSITMASRGFVANNTYTLILQGTGADLISQEELIFTVSTDDDPRPIKGTLITKFKPDEIKSKDFGLEPVVGIPLFKNGTSANIGFKSKTKIFSGDRDVFAYLALPSSTDSQNRLFQFAFPDKIINITTSGSNTVGDILVPIEIEYQLSKSIVSDFSKSLTSNRVANLKFPGKTYSKYNFSSLQNIDEAYILLTGRPLAELVGSNANLTLASEDYGILKLGGDKGPAFIEPSSVLGFAADIGGTNILSSFANDPFALPEDIFGTNNFTPDIINVSGKINRLAVIVSGVEESFLRKRYTIKLGGQDISNKISRAPEIIHPGEIIFVFDNVTPEIDGVLALTVDKKEKKFGPNYSTSGYAGQTTAIINGEEGSFYTIDLETDILTVNTDITSSLLIQDTSAFLSDDNQNFGIIGSSAINTNILESLYPNADNDGLIFDPRVTETEVGPVYFSYTPMTVTSSTKLELDTFESTGLTTLLPGISQDIGLFLNRSFLTIPSGTTFSRGSYAINTTQDGVLLFINTNTTGLASIKYNVPEVISIGEEDQDPILLASGEEIAMVVGRKYKVRVKNTDRDFIIKFDEIVLKPRGRPEPTEIPGEFIAIIEAPIAMLAKENCFEICASTDNAVRNRAKFTLGRDFVIDLDEIFQDMLLGPLKDKIPDIADLFDKLKDAPLRFVNFLLDKAQIPKDLIKSFCDLSFHLLAELKISLNGFQVLMVPIQVIFCIIDVICSLLNPIKIAKSVIRLFQCLYDLILLLPQISIPVMFLQLILHLLELLQCVIDKILFTITAINEISKAINAAAQKPINFTAIKALEETLSEYLFEIEADLSFLEPVLSILAIFLQLLQLVFRFPCNITPGSGEPDCGVDGTLLAGIVAGIAAPELTIIPDVMLPIAQTYSTDQIRGSTESGDISEPVFGNIIATSATGTFLDSMNVDTDSLRADGSGVVNFNATMAPTFTKSKKRAGKPTEVEFQFNGRGLSTTLNSKNIDPNQSVDTPLAFFDKVGDQLRIIPNGNLFSPIDGQAFLNINGNTASVRPLILELEIPVFEADPTTGIPVQTGTDTITRTFDNIPKMVLMDDEFNVYFIQPNGIVYNNDGFIDSITADIVNTASAPKQKFSREDVELDLDNDPTTDDGKIEIFDFPQLYFFDMRQAGEQLEQFCSTASINSFPFEDNNADDITDIVNTAQDCLTVYLAGVRDLVSSVRTSQTSGSLPLPIIDTTVFDNLNTTVTDCLNGTVDDICKYVINGLNTSFKILEDSDETPLEDFTDGEITEDVLDGFQSIGPAFTGAREYAAGIGDSATISTNSAATIEIIPRDSYDEEVIGDFTDRIVVEIISDTSGAANFISNPDGSILTRDGTSYTVRVTSSEVGEVKLRARVCDRTIQALTFDGIDVGGTEINDTTIDCIPDNVVIITTNSPPLGSLTKVDRILTIFFVKSSNLVLSDNAGGEDTPLTTPQEFGSGLVN